ncbi:MAG: outer membrane beta-barrel protein [Acetobacter sp.]|uniref:outer membrane beta-barrel protein n=1 Tax=Acetobacter sp. TaxID=440 RepID=UPI0039E95395
MIEKYRRKGLLLSSTLVTASLILPYAAHAQTVLSPAPATAPVVNINAPKETPAPDALADNDKLVDDDVAETEESLKVVQGNIFHPKAGKPLSYWDGLVGHLTVEAGIAGNPWTRSARNFGQFYVDRANTVTLNQIMGSLSHPVTSIGDGYGFGFNFEVMYGSDARFDPTAGMGDGSLTGLYQWVPTQAHVDFHMPWLFKRGIDVQLGQMYGLLGSEGTPALARPFYTFNYASDYIVPFQVIGIYTTLHLNKHVDWILGIDAGNSTSFGNAGNNSRPKGTFGFAFNDLMDGKLSFHLLGHFGPQGNNGESRAAAGWYSVGVGKIANEKMQYNGDILATYKLNKKMTITIDGTYLHDDLARDDVYGVTSYFAYDINPNLTFNARGEILRDNTGGTIAEYSSFTSFTKALTNQPYPYYVAAPTTFGALTVGVTYRPEFINKHVSFGQFTFRPEVRLDKSLNGTRPFNQAGTAANPVVNNGTSNMLWFNADAIWAF